VVHKLAMAGFWVGRVLIRTGALCCLSGKNVALTVFDTELGLGGMATGEYGHWVMVLGRRALWRTRGRSGWEERAVRGRGRWFGAVH